MNSDSTVNAHASINEVTSFLDVAQITSDNVSGNRIITFQRKGTRQTTSIDCTDSMWEPFIYPLFFFYGERGWGADIRQTLRYPDYLISRLLRPEKIFKNGQLTVLKVPNQSFDKFLRPIIKQLIGPNGCNDDEDEAYQYYSEVLGKALTQSTDYVECVKSALHQFCTEMTNVTNIDGFDNFCETLKRLIPTETLLSIKNP